MSSKKELYVGMLFGALIGFFIGFLAYDFMLNFRVR